MVENFEVSLKSLWKLMETNADPRTTNWFLMQSPFPVILISVVYFIAVQILVPNCMERRKAFDIKAILWLYNIWHLTVNAVFFYLSSTLAWLSTYNWRCEPVDRSPEGVPLTIANVCWWFLMFKVVDLFETLILVCGKRYELVTKYHVVHHFLMPIMIWGAVKFVPGGQSTFFAFVNTFTHIIIYGYLTLIGAFGNLKRSFPWFRKFHSFLTAAEILAVLVHTVQLMVTNDCNFPIAFVYYMAAFAVLYLILSTFCHHRSSLTHKDLMNSY